VRGEEVAVKLEVVACDAEHLRAALDDVPALAQRLGAAVAEDLITEEFRESFRYSQQELLRRPEIFGWWTALFVLDEPRVVCGAGGFRGPPSQDGMVEIGYSIAPAWRGKGLATAAAHELVRISLADPRVVYVQAHTLAQPNPSTRVLEKAGFRRVAQLIDPMEHPGPIWRWRLDRP
jgi:RimJ/RimL family protein N-acetyltransferase